jgi:hypothetical protein
MYKIKLTESLFPPQTNGELSDVTVGELLNFSHFFALLDTPPRVGTVKVHATRG